MSLYAVQVREAVAGSVDAEKLAEAWRALHPADVSKSIPAALAAFLGRARTAISDALKPVLTRAVTEAWVLGNRSALAAVDSLADVDWGGWKPGDYAAAEQVAGPGLRQLLDEQHIRIKSIAESRLEELSQVLEDTLRSDEIRREPTGPLPPFLSVGDLAERLKSVLDNPGRAELVAQAEIARAQATAARQVYAETGRSEVEVSSAEDDDVCPECKAAVKLGAHPLGAEPLVPLHPRCRCAELPVLDSEPVADEPAPPPFQPLDLDEGSAQEWLEANAPRLSDEQEDAVDDYSAMGYALFNTYLRGGDLGGARTKGIAEKVAAIDSAMSPLPADLLLTRLVGPKAFPGVSDYADLAGKMIADPAYQSTSLGGPLAKFDTERGLLLHIAAPKGTPALMTGPLSRDPAEREVLLARGTRLAIARVAAIAGRFEQWEAWATVVSDEDAAKSSQGKSGKPVPASERQLDAVYAVLGPAPERAMKWGAK